jgi:hypothetical protein
MGETVTEYLERMAVHPSMKPRYAEQIRLAIAVFSLLHITKIEDAILIVIGQHAGASDEVVRLQAEVARLQALLTEARGRLH